jgi:hypothetical protein
LLRQRARHWIPAYAGMTDNFEVVQSFLNRFPVFSLNADSVGLADTVRIIYGGKTP